MYKRLPSFALGFHGCDRSVGESILGSPSRHLRPSENSYDWLGHGIYFWESSPRRAYEFAVEAQRKKHLSKGRIRHPFVIGAIIDLGNCFNLLEASALAEMRNGHTFLKGDAAFNNREMPCNTFKDISGCFLVRDLDCSVIEAVHDIREVAQRPPYDSVRAALWEGDALYEGAGLLAKNHIQICVRNPLCIKGYFRVREIDEVDVSDWNAAAFNRDRHNGRASRSPNLYRAARRPAPVNRRGSLQRARWRSGLAPLAQQVVIAANEGPASAFIA